MNLISMQISYHISHQTGFNLGVQACVYTVCFRYATVYVTYDRTWRIDATLLAQVPEVIFIHIFFLRAKRASNEQRRVNEARSAEKKITLECVT